MFDMTNSPCTVALTREAIFLGHQAASEKRGRGYQPLRTMTPFPARSGWTERSGSELPRGPAVLSATHSLKWQGRTPVPSIPAPSRGVSLLRETNEDFLITRLIWKIEDLHIPTGSSVPKKTFSARSSIVHLAQEPTICCDPPESARVLRHHHSNQLRMLTHRWKRLGLQYPASTNRDDHTFERSQEKSQDEVKTDCPLRITAIQTSHTEALRARKQRNEERMKGSLYSSSDVSNVGIPEVKVCDMDSQSKTAVSLEFNSDDSDISDQEKENVRVSKWDAPVELDLRPEPFDKDLDLPCSTEMEVQVYAEVLPAPLKDLDFTQGLSSTEYSEDLQSPFTSDPCLAPMVARLLELQRLQAATVQKERAKPVRSRPTTASIPTRNASRLRNGDPTGSKLGISGDTECNSVTCSFTKLVLCPNSLCRGRHHTCPLTKSGQGSRSLGLQQTLPKRPQTMSGKFNRTESVVPSISISPKPTTSNRIKTLRATTKSTKSLRADSPPTSAKTTVTVLNRKA